MPTQAPPTRIRRVCLIVMAHAGYGQRLADGVITYLTRLRDWDLRLVRAASEWHYVQPLSAFDGVIVETRRYDQIQAYKGPIVRVLGEPTDPIKPAVSPDNPRIGRLAAHHFLHERGHQHLAFCGVLIPPYAQARLAGFKEAAAEHGIEVHVPTYHINPLLDQSALSQWLTQLPTPIGLFTPTDHDSAVLAQLCRKLNLMVPEQIALLGVDDDELLCRASTPPLSSIDHGAFRVGFEAAAMLDRMMKGQPIEQETVVIPPVGLIQRQSTDTLAVEDIEVARAVRYIRDNATEGIKVKDVCNAIPASRRTLELAFKHALGRTIHQEIHRVRVARALELLTWTDMPVADICARTGFSYPSRLAAVVREETGQTPRQYRRQHRPS